MNTSRKGSCEVFDSMEFTSAYSREGANTPLNNCCKVWKSSCWGGGKFWLISSVGFDSLPGDVKKWLLLTAKRVVNTLNRVFGRLSPIGCDNPRNIDHHSSSSSSWSIYVAFVSSLEALTYINKASTKSTKRSSLRIKG